MMRILVILLFISLSGNLSAWQSPEPLDILKKSSQACKALKYVEYYSRSEQPGLIVEANVINENAEVADVGLGPARLIVQGERVFGDNTQPFQFSYDGTEFKFHELGKGEVKSLTDLEPASIGRLLGLFYYNIVSPFLVKEKGLDHLLDNLVSAEYVGEEELEHRAVHHIRLTRSIPLPGEKQGRKNTSSWYFDTESFLPVKRVFGSVSVYNKYLNLEPPKTPVTYDINASEDYSESKVTGNEPNTEGLLTPGSSLPSFSLPDRSGVIQSFADVRGKVTLIDFWGTWCAPCLKAMPKLQALYDTYKAQGLQLVGISVADKPGKAESFVAKNKYTYQFLFNGDPYAKGLGLNVFPTVYLVDENGRVLHAEKGNRPGIEITLEKIIRSQLKLDRHDR